MYFNIVCKSIAVQIFEKNFSLNKTIVLSYYSLSLILMYFQTLRQFKKADISLNYS